MKVIAVTSFSGAVSMYAGEVREIPQGEILSDLLRAGYVREEKKAKTKGRVKADADE